MPCHAGVCFQHTPTPNPTHHQHHHTHTHNAPDLQYERYQPDFERVVNDELPDASDPPGEPATAAQPPSCPVRSGGHRSCAGSAAT